MQIKGLVEEDFANYKKPSMFIITPKCSFKCDKECGQAVCQNSPLATIPIIKIDNETIINKYITNPISHAVVIGGLEPFDTFDELLVFCMKFRDKCNDDIVIYTGYEPDEITEEIKMLSVVAKTNLYIKFGRFIPNQEKHFDTIIGVNLASDNQRGVKIC